jgi:hypothetical protein
METEKFKLMYHGSKPWVVFWAIVFFPLALAMLFVDTTLDLDGKSYQIHYSGSKNWLCFWIVFCMPVALVLLVVHGVSVSGRAANAA